jgi:hypothetical protein
MSECISFQAGQHASKQLVQQFVSYMRLISSSFLKWRLPRQQPCFLGGPGPDGLHGCLHWLAAVLLAELGMQQAPTWRGYTYCLHWRWVDDAFVRPSLVFMFVIHCRAWQVRERQQQVFATAFGCEVDDSTLHVSIRPVGISK